MTTPTGSALTLAGSVAAYVVVSLLGSDPFGMIDLRVYYEGAHQMWDDTSLYTFRSSALGLPFTYPPFAAIVFSACAWMPWTVCQVLWQLGSLGAIAAIGHLALRLTEDAADLRSARERCCLTALLTAAALWMEPVRSTMNFGQVNLFIAAALLGGLAATRSWIAGTTVGLCTAVKLVPGITVLYYVLCGRSRAVAVAAVTAALAAWVGLVTAPRSTWTFFTAAIVDPARAGAIDAVNNQSVRGALARIMHHDQVLLWGVAVVALVVIGSMATRACIRENDRLGAFLVVQLVGLLVSPISWNHHWVWVLPLIIWAEFGPLRRHRIVNTLSALWQLAVISFVVSVQIASQQPGVVGHDAWGQGLYPALGVLTVVGIWTAHRSTGPLAASSTAPPAQRPTVGVTR